MSKAIGERSAIVGVIGLGYVGLPLAAAAVNANFLTVGFDIDPAKVALTRNAFARKRLGSDQNVKA